MYCIYNNHKCAYLYLFYLYFDEAYLDDMSVDGEKSYLFIFIKLFYFLEKSFPFPNIIRVVLYFVLKFMTIQLYTK